MLKKIICLGVLLVMCLGLFIGCGGNKYNAIVISDGYTFKPNFLKENRTRDSHYLDENGELAVAEGESYPQYRVFCFKSQAESDAVFSNFSASIDYEKEMLIIYFFTSYNSSLCKIDKVILEANVLIIRYKYEKPQNRGDNITIPMQRCLIVKIDKLEVESIEFAKA